MRRLPCPVFAPLVLAIGLWSAPAAAACRLALLLGFDVSRSVDAADYAIQHEGVLAALKAPEIRTAFLSGDGWVALSVFEWSGRNHQEMVLDWMAIRSGADLDTAIAALEAHERLPVSLPTAIGRALRFANRHLRDAPGCAAQTLDLSGDGRNNDGYDPRQIYERDNFGNLTVNALAIGGHETDIVRYFATQVIRGPGAFVIEAETHLDFPAAIRAKLERELSAPMLGALGVAPAPKG